MIKQKQDLLYSFRDNCGFGLVCSLKNKQTHSLFCEAKTALERMMHRGAIDADGKSGDGSGMLFSMPKTFMQKVALQKGVDLPAQYGIGMIFYKQKESLEQFIQIAKSYDMKVILERNVPINKEALGEFAKACLPNIVQVFLAPNTPNATRVFSSLLYLIAKKATNSIKKDEDFYICSLSDNKISYKGLFVPGVIDIFYPDLSDKDFAISYALIHQRFSTNTLPKWKLAQPFRNIAHNGEINSISANKVQFEMKQNFIKSDVFSQEQLQDMYPILENGLSDSGSFDNVFEFLLQNGVDFFKAARSMVQAPWQNTPFMDYELRSFYEYKSINYESWDGPAAISMISEDYIACLLDRNGLRPAKYMISDDDNIYISSEYGTIDIDPSKIKKRGKLQSGQMIAIDFKNAEVLYDDNINNYLKSSQNYDKWLSEKVSYLHENSSESFLDVSEYTIDNLVPKQRFFNITYESMHSLMEPMAMTGKESVSSMGDDTPLACFSQHNRSFFDFFKQKFAQVTNPAIDPYRERIVMSLNVVFHNIAYNLLEENKEYSAKLKTTSPVLMKEKFDVLKQTSANKDYSYQFKTYCTCFDANLNISIKTSLVKLYKNIKNDIVQNNTNLISLDDRHMSATHIPMPIAFVVGYINTQLIKDNLRSQVSLICVSGEVFTSHACGVLLAFGGDVIYPYMLYASVYDRFYKKDNDNKYDLQEKLKKTFQALNDGILRIMSKMGIATIASYKNSSLHDVIGLSENIVDDCFPNCLSILHGLTYDDIQKRLNKLRHNSDNYYPNSLEFGGLVKYVYGQEFHDYTPSIMKLLNDQNKCDSKDFAPLKEFIGKRDKKFIRDFLEFKSDRKSIDIKKVEAKEDIFKRFASAAMSCGSISIEAHEALAMAMNTIGGVSNSGEGGEDTSRYNSLKNSSIKQVASGRFGVNANYLNSAKEIQIKIAQGAKPGEGGQLPGSKVSPYIAKLRCTNPGVTLISPPPHHDIYSIEDLSQLIFDLKQVNPNAYITVKLVSSLGVGTIACGVTKAYADKIIISGGDGGTGAASIGSIKHAGNPWEIGLIETHNALKVNKLRSKIHLQTDGGLKSGTDIVKAAMLGAQSYAFGTILLTLLGCKILRICHTNKCSVGVATQDSDLREHFKGSVERVIAYFTFLSEDVREILASLGYEKLDDIIGRNDLLKLIDDDMCKKFDFSQILRKVEGVNINDGSFNEPHDDNDFEKQILKKVQIVLDGKQDNIIISSKIQNTNRSFGALISGAIVRKNGLMGVDGEYGLKKSSIKFDLKGIAGQSFGAFLCEGIDMRLQGCANDYVGKGMSGGKIIINSPSQGQAHAAVGNTCLYGATGGVLYVNSGAGERFGVRNSGAKCVVEGVGDHACEYMTGGIITVLGQSGINFGAGMTGGLAFVYDEHRDFSDKVNSELVELLRIDTDNAEKERLYLKHTLQEYIKECPSNLAIFILKHFRSQIRNFWLVKPKNTTMPPLNPDEGD